MREQERETTPEKLTINNIAEDLGISKSTVSRAISGKGRIGKDTVKRVFAYIEEHNYKPSTIAKGLATSKTYNIGVVLPADVDLSNTPFFQGCLCGICEVTSAMDYDVIVTTIKESDITLLKRLVERNKVDGIILTRNLINDVSISYLKHKAIPFVLLGSCEDDAIVQIDYNHMEACEMLISHLLMDGLRRIALIAGDRNHRVNRYRCEGYYNALSRHGIAIEQDMVHLDCSSQIFIEQALHSCLKRQAECIVCTDDMICGKVAALLREEGYGIPDNIKVASFYDSVFLEMQNPPITAIGFNAQELGTIAGKRVIALLNGEENKFKTVLDYEIHLRRSTKNRI